MCASNDRIEIFIDSMNNPLVLTPAQAVQLQTQLTEKLAAAGYRERGATDSSSVPYHPNKQADNARY